MKRRYECRIQDITRCGKPGEEHGMINSERSQQE